MPLRQGPLPTSLVVDGFTLAGQKSKPPHLRILHVQTLTNKAHNRARGVADDFASVLLARRNSFRFLAFETVGLFGIWQADHSTFLARRVCLHDGNSETA